MHRPAANAASGIRLTPGRHAGMLSRLLEVPLALHPAKYRSLLAVMSERSERVLTLEALKADLEDNDLDARAEGRPYLYKGVAVIPVEGTLVYRSSWMDSYSGLVGYDGLLAQIQAAYADARVHAIGLALRTGGGECDGMLEFSDALYALRIRNEKPIVGVVDPCCYSAGVIGILSACGRRFGPRLARVGSVGVISGLKSIKGFNEGHGIDVRIIYAGAKKADGHPDVAITDGAVADVQARVDQIYALACATVDRNYGQTAGFAAATQAGIFMGDNAVAAGLLDGIATLDEVIESLAGTQGV